MWLYAVANKTALTFDLNIMITDTKQTENLTESGNCLKPLLALVFITTYKF